MLLITPADTTPLTTPITVTDVEYAAGRNNTMPGTAGFGELCFGRPDATTRKISLALNKLPSALAGYLVAPRVSNGGTITIDSYSRQIDTYNVIEAYSDRDQTAGVMETLENIYVQRAPQSRSFETNGLGDVVMTLELIGLEKFLFESMRATDVEADCFENESAVGPFPHVYSNVWTDGGRLYTVRHGDDDGSPNYREYTFHSLAAVYRSIARVAELILSEVMRRAPVTLTVASDAGSGADFATSRDHWEYLKHDHTTAYDATDGVVGNGDKLVCTRIAMHATPTAAFHGFLNTPTDEGAEAPEDTLASWKTVWDFLGDETRAAIAKLRFQFVNNSGTLDGSLLFQEVLAPHPEGELLVAPEDCIGNIKGVIGKDVIPGATAVSPAATSNDAEPVDVAGLYGTEADANRWGVPRGFHTNPIAWPSGDRVYETDESGSSTYLHLTTQAFNCLTLYYLSDAGGALAASAPIRCHVAASLTTGQNTVAVAAPAVSLPAPNPIDDYAEDLGEGDTDYGSRYEIITARSQRESGAALLAANAVLSVFGSPQQTEYDVTVSRDLIMPDSLGNQLDVSSWPDGNSLLGGATYFGDIPGVPFVRSVEDDLLGQMRSNVKLLAPGF